MVQLGNVIPILRSFDEAKARAFYVDFLGFEIEFEHRFSDNAPLYLGLRYGPCRLHVSEHFGDSSPGVAVRITTDDVTSYMRALNAKNYKYAAPGTEERAPTPWGTIEATIADPFGNKLIFVQEA